MMLKIMSVFFCVSISAMEFIDSQGRMCQLPVRESLVFYASDLGQQLADDVRDGRQVDFSTTKKPGLRGSNIRKVLTHIHDPAYLTPTNEVVPEEVELLETAHILGLAQQKCIRHFAYRLWPLVQKNGPNPLGLSDEQKGYVRVIARPHMPCPTDLLSYLQKNDIDAFYNRHSGILNLSAMLCYAVGYPHKFGTLAGLEQLMRYLDVQGGNLQEIILDGHMLDTFSLYDIQRAIYNLMTYHVGGELRRLSMRNNYINELSEHQINTYDLPTGKLDLSNNLIGSVSDRVFQAINRHRARHRVRYEFTFCLERNQLSEDQKKVLQKKFYNATHTIPERLTVGNIVTYKYVLALAPLFALFKNPDYFEEPTMMRAAVGLMVCFWWYYLFVNRFDIRLAQLAHSTIEDTWGGDMPDRSRVIWPKNSAKLML